MLPSIACCRVLFSDIDGTLLNSKGEITPDTLKGLHRWTSSGRALVLCSSRSREGILPLVRRYDLSCDLITLGGAAVYRAGGELLFSSGMGVKIVRAVAEFCESSALPCIWNAYTPERWLTPDPQDPRVLNEQRITGAVPEECAAKVLPEQTYGKLLLICDPAGADRVEAAVRTHFPECQVLRSAAFLVEVNPAGIDKGTGVQAWCEARGITPGEACAFGDQFNDVPMLNAVGMPVLMGNAPAALKMMFPLHTADNDHDGIAKALL